MKAVERFRIAAGVPGRMCPAAVRSWQEPSHTVCRASTPFRSRSPPTRPYSVCPSGVAQQPLAGVVVLYSTADGAKRMFSRRNAARTFKNIYRQPCPSRKQPCPFRNPRGGPTSTSRICAGRYSRVLLQCTRRARVRSEPLPLPVAQYRADLSVSMPSRATK